MRRFGTCRLRAGQLREAEAYDKLGRPEAAAEWRKKAESVAAGNP